MKTEVLAAFERLTASELIDLYYESDESGVPYIWQFADERVAMPCARQRRSIVSAYPHAIIALDGDYP